MASAPARVVRRSEAARRASRPRRTAEAREPMNRCTDESAGLIGGPAKEQPAETRVALFHRNSKTLAMTPMKLPI